MASAAWPEMGQTKSFFLLSACLLPVYISQCQNTAVMGLLKLLEALRPSKQEECVFYSPSKADPVGEKWAVVKDNIVVTLHDRQGSW